MNDVDLEEQLLLILARHLDGSGSPLTVPELADQAGRPVAELLLALLALEKFRMVNVAPRSRQVTLRPLLRFMVLIGDLRASQRDGEISHVAVR